jgi:hypothetical protein
LEAYVSTVVQVQQLEAALRRTKPGVGERYQKLARLHRQAAMLAGSLATKLRLAPLSKLDKCQPTDGDLPVG